MVQVLMQKAARLYSCGLKLWDVVPRAEREGLVGSSQGAPSPLKPVTAEWL